jgi:threonine dehydrogenase-like Zn-dependent dehydrogenase
VVYDGTQLALADAPRPALQGDQQLLQIRLAGICNTDLEITRGYKNFTGILGHEFVAEVVAGAPQWVGQRVVGEINVACGECESCLRGMPTHCLYRATVGIKQHAGAFAEYLALTARNLHIVPPAIPDEAAVFVEPLAAALQILEVAQIAPHDRVILIGAGKLGLLCAQVLRLTGADVQVITRRAAPAKLLQQWGIPTTSLEAVSAKAADVVVDCTGVADGFAEALRLVRPRGTIVLKSTYVGQPSADLTRVVIDEIRVVGSRCGSFAAALRLLASGQVAVTPLIQAQYPLEAALTAFRQAEQPGMLKVLLSV